MKISRLSPHEVANTSAIQLNKRYQKLVSIEEPRVRWGYKPVLDALPKLLLAESGLFGHLPAGDEKHVIAQIEKDCKSGPKQRKACSEVATALQNWRREAGASGRMINPEPLRMTVDTLRYCADVAVVVDGKLFVVFLDPRATMTLSIAGSEFIKSLIHHTALVGDLRGATPAILSTPKLGGTRTVNFEILDGEPRHTLDDLMTRVSETYSIWETILRARTGDGRGTGTA